MQIEEPDDRQLRDFGASLALMLAVLAGLAQWHWQATFIAIALAVVSVLLAVVYYAVPATRRSIYRGFRLLTLPIQHVVTALILALVFYLVVTPIGLALRACGKGIRRGGKQDAATYWIETEEINEPDDYFRTY